MAKKIYIGAEKQFTITNLLGACDDVGNRTASEPIFINQSIYKTGAQSWIFIPTADATEVTYTLRQSANTPIKPHLIPSHKYYFSAWLQQLTPSFGQGSFDFYWPVQEPVFLSGAKPDKANEWCLVSAIKERSSFAEGDYECRVDWNDAKANLGMFFDGLTLVDLTAAFGAGNEPDQAWCDANIPFTKTTATVSRGTAHNVKNMFIGVDGKARKVKKAYVGVNSVARLFYQSKLDPAISNLWVGSSSEVTGVTYANGYYVACGHHIDGNTYYARIAYTTELNGQWTTKDLWSGTSNATTINCITYENGYWVVGGLFRSGSNNCYARIGYSTSLDGTWTFVDVWSGDSTYNSVFCIAYANGYWVVGGDRRTSSSSTRYSSIAYATNLSGAWTLENLYSSGSNTAGVYDICYANGYWVACIIYRNSSNYFTYISYATSPDKTWTSKQVASGYRPNCMTYANGYWVIGSLEYGRVYYTENITAAWSYIKIGNSSVSNNINNIYYANGYWVICGNDYTSTDGFVGVIYYSTSITGTWTKKIIWAAVNTGLAYVPINDIVYGNEYWLLGGEFYDGIDTSRYGRIAYASSLDEFGQL